MASGTPLSSSPPTSHPRPAIPTSSRTSRASLRTSQSSDILSDHPLLAPQEENFLSNSTNSSGQYAVYKGKKSGGLGPGITTGGDDATAPPPPPSSSSSLSSTGNLSPNLSPTGATHLPPLISRPSNSTLPSTLRRPPARSVSEAKEKLLGQQLQATVQGLGLGTESAGWAMVQKLGGIGKESEWASVMGAIGSGKVTLLLPSEKVLYASQLTPTFYLDHLVLFDSALPSTSRSSAPDVRGFATLSGFRGSLVADQLHFTSCGNGLTESARGLLKPGSLQHSPNFADPEVQRFLSGAAYPQPPATTSSLPYPTASLLSPISNLSVPRSSRTTPNAPNERKTESIGRVSGSTGSRLAALFGKSPVPSPNESKEELQAVANPPSDTSDSQTSSTDDLSASPSPAITPSPSRHLPDLPVSVLAISKVIRHADFVKNIGKALDSQLRESLKSIDGLEVESGPEAIDRIATFCSRFQPPPNWSNALAAAGKPLLGDSFYVKDVEEVSDTMQDLLHVTRLDLAKSIRTNVTREKRKEKEGEGLGIERDPGEEEDLNLLEERVDAALEKVEEVLTLALYDRIFSPGSSGDAQEDENLSSRIAALNILDLTLEHLGLDLRGDDGSDDHNRSIRESIEDIIGLASQELQRLQDVSVRTPRAKLTVFVNLHKIVVDGLSGLPPIPLKHETTPGATSRVNEEVEMDDAASRTASRPASPPASSEEAMLRTPRPRLGHGNSVPEFTLPAPLTSARFGSSQTSSTSSLTGQLASSVHDATSSSVFDTTPSRDTSSPSTSSADLILPLLIYLVVQYNPLRLPSTLHYVQRFRSESLMRGEASYCATNMSAVTEFINHADISALGLSSAKIKSLSDRSPVLYATGFGDNTTPTRIAPHSKTRTTNVSQDIDQFVDSANHALVNVVDSSYKLLFGPKGFAPKTLEDVKGVLDGAGTVASRARGTLLRRTTMPSQGRHDEDSSAGSGGVQREMVDIGPEGLPIPPPATDKEVDDTRSVKSISSIIRDSSIVRSLGDKKDSHEERPSLGDRLASIPGLGRFGSESKATGSTSSPDRTSLFSAFAPSTSPSARRATINSSSPLTHTGFSTPTFHSPGSNLFGFPSGPVTLNAHFMTCEAGDLKLSEIGDLLAEYKKLAEVVARAQAAHEAQEKQAASEGESIAQAGS